MPELGLLFNRKKRPNKGPTQSILQGAKVAIAKSRERSKLQSMFSTVHATHPDSDEELVGQRSYIELEDQYKHATTAFSTPNHEHKEDLEEGIRVKYDVKIEHNRVD